MTPKKQAKPQARVQANIPEFAEEMDAEDWDELEGEFGDDWTFELYKLGGRGESGGFLRKVEREELSEIRDWLRDNVGPGPYSIVKKEKGKIRGRKHFRIASFGAVKPTAVAARAPDAPAETAMMVMFRQMEERAARRDQLMMEVLRGAVANRSHDPLQELERLSVIFSNINGQRAQTSGETALNLVLKGMEIAKVQEGGGDGGGIAGVLRDVLNSPMVGELMQGLKQAAIAPPAGSTIPPAVQPAPAARPGSSNGAPSLADQLAFLVTRAQAGNDPAVYAEMLVDVLPEEHLQALMEAPDPLAPMEAIAPAMAQHRPWFQAMLDAIREIVQGEGEPLPGDDAESNALDPGRSPPAAAI